MATITTPTRAQVQAKMATYALANSDLTSVRTGGRMSALQGADSAVLSDFYRDLRVSLYQDVIQGTFDAFQFSALSGDYAGVTLTLTVSEATTVPQGFLASTVGSPTNPAVIFQTTASVSSTAAGTVTVTASCTQVGALGNVPAGSITNTITPTPGVTAVTNASAASGGTDPETLSRQQVRFQTFLQSIARATPAALAYTASQVSGVELASAVSPAQLYAFEDASGAYTDWSQSINTPKGVPFSPFTASPTVGDTFSIGADRPFTALYFDVATPGSALSTTWQYWNGTAWANLTPTTDGTSGGQTSGTVSWAVPSAWAPTSINGSSALYFVRLYLDSATFTTMPQYYSAFANDPPPGFAFVYVTVNPSATNVLQSVQTALENARASGDTVTVLTATTASVAISLTITPTTYGSGLDLQTAAETAIQALFDGLQIGQSLPLSAITGAVTALYGGQAVAEVDISTPTANVTASPSELLTLGTLTVSIAS